MESQEKFQSYNDVNKEIQALIASKENRPYRESTYKPDDTQDVLTLLESLNRTYSEINAALRTENSQALKDVILKSDIKMSMVCETLLDTLKKTTEEKNNLIRENQNLEKTRRELESTNINNKIQMDKMRNEIDFKKVNVDELNRIIRDQKDRMNEFKEETFKSRNEVQFFKAKIDELENLRNRANERMGVYEKELDALNIVIKDKDSRIQELVIEKKEEEEKNSNVKARISELESIVDIMNKKMEIKDKNMTLCNSELSKVLCENKKYKVEYEKYKESSVYYEGLYNSISSQNAYLNNELNKMLKMAEYTKDIEGCINKFRKKLKKKKKALRKIEKENKELKERLEEHSESKIADETSDSLLKRIDELNSNNSKFRNQIAELESEKRQLENKLKNMRIGPEVSSVFKRNHTESKSFPHSNKEITPGGYMSNLHTVVDNKSHIFPNTNVSETWKNKDVVSLNRGIIGPSSYYVPKTNIYQSSNNMISKDIINENPSCPSGPSCSSRPYGFHGPYGYGNRPSYVNPSSNINYPGNSNHSGNTNTINPSSYALQKPEDTTYLKLFNLENEYEENKQKDRNDFIGGFIKDADVTETKLQHDYQDDIPQSNKITLESSHTKNMPNLEAVLPVDSSNKIERGSVQMKNTDNLDDMYNLKRIDEQKDNVSVDSIKTYHTSSTLKDMMARTDNLQKKFQDLENKLAQINEGDSVDKLTDKIKTYNSYYSEWNAESNESDYI